MEWPGAHRVPRCQSTKKVRIGSGRQVPTPAFAGVDAPDSRCAGCARPRRGRDRGVVGGDVCIVEDEAVGDTDRVGDDHQRRDRQVRRGALHGRAGRSTSSFCFNAGNRAAASARRRRRRRSRRARRAPSRQPLERLRSRSAAAKSILACSDTRRLRTSSRVLSSEVDRYTCSRWSHRRLLVAPFAHDRRRQQREPRRPAADAARRGGCTRRRCAATRRAASGRRSCSSNR